jgi:predicted RecA/RadA family phage recombinase
MKKISLFAGLLPLVGLLATTAFSQPLSVRNGIVRFVSPGKTMTIAGFNHTQYDYTMTSNTKILPSTGAADLQTGSRVTVYAKCYSTMNTSGCVAVEVVVVQALAPSAQNSASPQATAQPAAQPTPTT